MIYLDPETGYIALLNGEIYNYRELWNDLSNLGVQPRTDLEAELIARMYQVYGLGFLKYLKGMFAIALFDKDCLVLGRDSLGIKPLYYTTVGRKVIACSEIKGILAHPQISPHLNTQSLKETSVFGYVVDQEATFFQGIHQVKPGSAIAVSADGTIEIHEYFKAPEARYANGEIHHSTYSDACRNVREYLIQTVEKMFSHGSMEKGVYLSGGLDSTTIALIAKRILNYPIKTFTLSDSEENPDFQAARGAASALETEHYEFSVKASDYWRALPDYVAHFESLMAGGVFHVQGGIAFHLLSERVAQHVKVAFSGEGADELFGGYARYLESENLENELKKDFEGLKLQAQRDQSVAALHGTYLSMPYLDARVVRAARLIPASDKVAGGVRKLPLREVAARHIPPELAWHDTKAMQYGSGVWKIIRELARHNGYKRSVQGYINQFELA